MKILLFALSVLMFLSGCVPQDLQPIAPTTLTPAEELLAVVTNTVPAAGTEGESTLMTEPAQLPSTSGFESLIKAAKEDLAQRLLIPIDQISLIEAKEVVWPDASLGCPQPDMKYKQVPEDGALVILQAKGIEYEYHNGGSRGLFLCEKITKNPEKPPQIDITKLTPPAPDNGIPPGEDH